MRTYLLLVAASVLVLLGSACTSKQSSEPEYRLTATIKDLMDSMVDPNADFVWDSVASVVDAKGITEKAPHTDEEWADVRHHTISLLEATNLLVMPGRKVAKPGEKADDPKVELSPDQIQALVDQDRESWMKLAHGLHDAVMVALKAVDAKDTEGLLNSGDGIDKACENCHLKYWYPNEAKAQEAQKQ
jgi:hypothetical protein